MEEEDQVAACGSLAGAAGRAFGVAVGGERDPGERRPGGRSRAPRNRPDPRPATAAPVASVAKTSSETSETSISSSKPVCSSPDWAPAGLRAGAQPASSTTGRPGYEADRGAAWRVSSGTILERSRQASGMRLAARRNKARYLPAEAERPPPDGRRSRVFKGLRAAFPAAAPENLWKSRRRRSRGRPRGRFSTVALKAGQTTGTKGDTGFCTKFCAKRRNACDLAALDGFPGVFPQPSPQLLSINRRTSITHAGSIIWGGRPPGAGAGRSPRRAPGVRK